ncbi:MAG: hypothetical protein GXP37_02375 [Chloroflexi bacterium]|nr:hypothetical protein [Chloroflexota bacterium]
MSFDFITSGYPGIDYIMPVNRAPNPGETGVILSAPPLSSPYLGGCVLNIAVGGARLGLRTAAIALLGDDPIGEHILQGLQADGVNTSLGIRTVEGGKSAVAFLFVDPEKQHQTFYYPGVSDQDEITLWLDEKDLSGTSWGVITVGNPVHNQQVLEAYVTNGLRILWTHKNDSHAFPTSLVKRLAEVSHLVVLNRCEASAVSSLLGLSDIRGLLSYAPEAIILTQGAEGCRLLTADGETQVPAVNPTAVVDPTGAGDGFTAGLLFGLCRGFSLKQSCRMGAVTASFVLESWGGQTNLPDTNALKERYLAVFNEQLV